MGWIPASYFYQDRFAKSISATAASAFCFYVHINAAACEAVWQQMLCFY